jgi:antitoxin FitA
MTNPTFTITLTADEAHRLQELAKKAGVSPEDLLRAGVGEWLARTEDDFTAAADYVLKKNAELYKRLA